MLRLQLALRRLQLASAPLPCRADCSVRNSSLPGGGRPLLTGPAAKASNLFEYSTHLLARSSYITIHSLNPTPPPQHDTGVLDRGSPKPNPIDDDGGGGGDGDAPAGGRQRPPRPLRAARARRRASPRAPRRACGPLRRGGRSRPGDSRARHGLHQVSAPPISCSSLLASFLKVSSLLVGWLAYHSAPLQVAAWSVQLHRCREEEGETLPYVHLDRRHHPLIALHSMRIRETE